MTAVTDLLTLVTLVCTTVLAVSAVLGLAYRYTLRPRLERITAAMGAVEYHLIPNGSELAEAHPEDRDLPLRVLTLRMARRQREMIHSIDDHNVGGSTWRRSHENEHLKRDPTWPMTP